MEPPSAHAGVSVGPPRIAVLASSSAANVVRSISSSLLTVALPLILVLVLPAASYSAWVLLFGMATYVIYLDLGLQPVVQSMVARFEGRGDHGATRRVVLSSLKLMTVVALFSLPLAYVVSRSATSLFPAVPDELISDFQVAFLVAVGGQLAILVSNVVMSYFAGRQRLLKPSLVVAFSRLAALVAAGLAASFSTSLSFVACALCMPLVFGLGVLLLGLRAEFKTSGQELDIPAAHNAAIGMKYLLAFSGPLILWNLCMIVVNGAGVILVGRLDYGQLAAFGVASMFVAVILGLENAFVGPLLSELGRRHATGASHLNDLLLSSRINGIFLAAISVGMLVAFPFVVQAFPPHIETSLSLGLVAIMLVSNQVRLSMTPLSMMYIATESHRRIVLPPVVEAAISVGSGLLLGMQFGLIGVVSGALLGSVLAVCLALTWSSKLAGLEMPNRWKLLSGSIITPLLCFSPSIVTAVVVGVGFLDSIWLALIFTVLSSVASAVLVWFTAFQDAERGLCTALVRHVLKKP